MFSKTRFQTKYMTMKDLSKLVQKMNKQERIKLKSRSHVVVWSRGFLEICRIIYVFNKLLYLTIENNIKEYYSQRIRSITEITPSPQTNKSLINLKEGEKDSGWCK